MSIQNTRMAGPLLTAAEEVELARRIEAGLYAENLLSEREQRLDRSALETVRAGGRAAWQKMWLANLRLVMQHATDFSRRHGLPVDDLFQEGCIGLAKAMQRFDHSRGLRFTTLAHEYVHRAVAASAARRCGMLDGPLHRQRVRQQIHRTREHSGDLSLRQLAELAGVTLDAAVTAELSFCSIDDVPAAQASVVETYARVEDEGTDFLNLLDDAAGEFLRLRFGIDRPPHSIRQLSALLNISPTTARRVEVSALQRARELLSQERCVLPPASSPDPTMSAVATALRTNLATA